MTEQELLQMRDLAEAGQVQFKERANNRYDIGCEMVAFSNSRGGRLVIGINDKSGAVSALSYLELQETTNLLTSIASENVIPNVLIEVDNVSTTGGAVVVATIPEGKNKPYHDNKGIIWVKNGADKRKVFDNSELAEMMSECGSFAPDEAAVPNATINDLDADTIKLYLMSRFAPVYKGKNIDELSMKDYSLDAMAESVIKGTTIEILLRNLRFIRPDGKITVAAMLLFGKYTQRWLPVMTAKCISYFGNSVGGTRFRDKMHDMEIEGNLLHQFRTIMNFFTRNLRKVQVEKEFKEITHAANEFVITIPRESNQAQAESNQVAQGSNQVMTANKRESNQAEEKSNQHCANLVTRKLTKKEEDIRNFCSVPRTAQEIMDRLKITNQSKNRQKYITSLIGIGVLERTIPEKPNDPNQKYRRKK